MALKTATPLAAAAAATSGPTVVARAGQPVELVCRLPSSSDNANGPLAAFDTSPISGPPTSDNDRDKSVQVFMLAPFNQSQLAPPIRLLDQSSSLSADNGPSFWPASFNFAPSDQPGGHLNDRLISLIFWYKDDNPAPIYTLDARQAIAPASGVPKTSMAAARKRHRQQHNATSGRHEDDNNNNNNSSGDDKMDQIDELNRRLLAGAKHYDGTRTSTSTWAHLGKLELTVDWPLVRLRLAEVRAHHSGHYKCRVDFRWARTLRASRRLLVQGEFCLKSQLCLPSDQTNV